MSPEKTVAIQNIINWLLDTEKRNQPLEDMATGLVDRLVQSGVPLSVMSTSQQAYQPEVAVRNYKWTREGGPIIRDYDHVTTDGPAYLQSPLKVSRDSGVWLRVRLDGPQEEIPYPICRELAEAGNTDYFVKAMPRNVSTYVSFSTDKTGGFTDDDIASILAVLPAVLLRLELYCSHYALSSLLHLYLGGNAAGRVIEGAFRLGGTEAIDAVVWMCDLRGFTSLTERTGPIEVLSSLNQYFSCVVSSVQDHGGEVLKFIGDAVLAIFPVGEGEKGACDRALCAAREAFQALDATNEARVERGDEELHFGLGLHLGRVFYGNIGTRTRLDFTVIGPTVNETARIESLCSGLSHRLLVSESFAKSADSSELISVGKHALKGVEGERELFTMDLT